MFIISKDLSLPSAYIYLSFNFSSKTYCPSPRVPKHFQHTLTTSVYCKLLGTNAAHHKSFTLLHFFISVRMPCFREVCWTLSVNEHSKKAHVNELNTWYTHTHLCTFIFTDTHVYIYYTYVYTHRHTHTHIYAFIEFLYWLHWRHSDKKAFLTVGLSAWNSLASELHPLPRDLSSSFYKLLKTSFCPGLDWDRFSVVVTLKCGAI